MLYRELGRTGDKVSILGYGCMRFPTTRGRIDAARAERQVLRAIELGVNYFDTAYLYPGSEAVLGGILAKGYRDQVLVATKMPPFLVHSAHDMEKTLQTSLQRLRTDRVDYYLMHSLASMAGWRRLKEAGAEEFLARTKHSGKIRRIGFSYHGDSRQFKEIVEDYPWDFCQIQYNYLDQHYQAGQEGLRYAAGKGLGVVVMEPLRGGRLAGRMPAEAARIFDGAGGTPAEWALRWVWNHPEVSCALSGMNEESQIEENIRTASATHPGTLTPEELALFEKVREILRKKIRVNCTGCGYCLPCPAGVNIPGCFSAFNNLQLFPGNRARINYFSSTMGFDGGSQAFASLCRDCGACEGRCPQHLPIRRHLKETVREMERFYFRPLAGLVRGYYRIRRKKGS